MEISFQNGVATAKLTVAAGRPASVGQTFTFDRKEQTEEFAYLQNAELSDKWKTE